MAEHTILEEVRRLAALASEMQEQAAQAVAMVRDFSAVATLLAAVNDTVTTENAQLWAEIARLQEVIRCSQGGVRA